jgi:type VI secretion system secreted protein Hcp
MAANGWMQIESEKHGILSAGAGSKESIRKGYVEGMEDYNMVWAWDHSIILPTDLATGQATGKRQHGQIMVTKQFDKSSPLLYQSLCSSDRLTRVEFLFQRVQGSDPVPFFKITLTEALITQIRSWVPNFQDPTQAHLEQMEDVYFAYRKIEWDSMELGTTAEDDWEKVRA